MGLSLARDGEVTFKDSKVQLLIRAGSTTSVTHLYAMES
jgi:hypothetical protein